MKDLIFICKFWIDYEGKHSGSIFDWVIFPPFLQENDGILSRSTGMLTVTSKPGLDILEDSTSQGWSLSFHLMLCNAACEILEAK